MTEGVALRWLVIGGAATAILVVAFGVSRDASVSRKVFARFMFNIALPLLVLGGLPLLALYLTVDLDERVWQAVIAGSFIAGGWLTTAMFSEFSRAEAKAERMRDYHKALYAEIGNALYTLWDEGTSEAYTRQIADRMRADDSFVPFMPRERHTHIYDAVLDEIEVLPRQTIDAIVAYYAQAKSIGALVDDMRGEGFRSLPQERRVAIYEDLAEMRKQAFAYGQYALALILAYSDGGAAAAEAEANRINSRASGPSGPSRGSG